MSKRINQKIKLDQKGHKRHKAICVKRARSL